MRSKNVPRLAIAGLVLGLSILNGLLPSRPAAAQEAGWTRPRLVYEGAGTLDWPALVADAYGQVHGFWTYQAEAEGNRQPARQIFYTRLDQANWPANDILLTSSNGVGVVAGAMKDGLLVLWNGSNYGIAGSSPEASARAWYGPSILPPALNFAGVATAPDGALWVINGSQESSGVFVHRIDPETHAWGAPVLAATMSTANTLPDAPRLAISAEGVFHAVWAEYQRPDGWPPRALYYARSIDSGQSWSTPRQLAPGNFNQPNVIVGPEQQVYFSWVGAAGTGGKFVRESLDGGLTWGDTITVRPPGNSGSQGIAELALDSQGTLHMVVADAGCIYYHVRTVEGWSDGECISAALPRNALKEVPAMTISKGNVLHVLFWTDRRQLWHTTLTLDVPALPVLPTTTAPVPTAAVVQPTSTPAPTATHLPDMGPPPARGQAARSGNLAMVAGAAPVVLLMAGLLLRQIGRRR